MSTASQQTNNNNQNQFRQTDDDDDDSFNRDQINVQQVKFLCLFFLQFPYV